MTTMTESHETTDPQNPETRTPEVAQASKKRKEKRQPRPIGIFSRARNTPSATLPKMPGHVIPLFIGACLATLAAMVVSTVSLLVLTDFRPEGWAIALTGDLLWLTITWAEYRHIGPLWLSRSFGWLTALVVGGAVAVHGYLLGNEALMILGPFLTLCSKVVWEFVLAGMRDRTAPTLRDQHALDEELRSINTESARARLANRRTVEQIRLDTEQEVDRIRAESERTRAQILAEAEEHEARAEARLRKAQADARVKDREDEMGYVLVRRADALSGELEQPRRRELPAAGQITEAKAERLALAQQFLDAKQDDLTLTQAQWARERSIPEYHLSRALREHRGHYG